MKARTELQLAAHQEVAGHSIAEMNLEQPSTTLDHTQASLHRSQVRNIPNETYVERNRDRMERNLLHRQYCRSVLQERQMYRQALEDRIETDFSRTKHKLLASIRSDGPYAPFPTVPLLHQETVRQQHEAAEQCHFVDELAMDMAHVTQFDDEIWSQRRNRKRAKRSLSYHNIRSQV
jgi:hypothetical protein